jgi:hypothetical protein
MWTGSSVKPPKSLAFRKLVCKIRSESARGPLVTPNKKRQSKGLRRNNREVKYDDFIRSSIRRKVYEFYFRNQTPTLNSILNAINKDPNFKKSTLHVLLREIGFEYVKKGNWAIVIERADIVMWRHDCLVAMKIYRNKGMNVVYMMNPGLTLEQLLRRCWKIRHCEHHSRLFWQVFPPTARVPRFALVHTENENGFLPNAQLVFLCKKNTADAHDEMVGEIYEQYFKDQVLPNLPSSSVMHPITAAKFRQFQQCHGGRTESRSGLRHMEKRSWSTCLRSI